MLVGALWSIVVTAVAIVSIYSLYDRYQRDVYYENLITKLKLLRDFHNNLPIKNNADIGEVRHAISEYFDEGQYEKEYSAWYWQIRGSDGSLHKSHSLRDCQLIEFKVYCAGESVSEKREDNSHVKAVNSGTISPGFEYAIYPIKGALNENIRLIVSNYISHRYLNIPFQYSLSGRYVGLDEIGTDVLLMLCALLAILVFGTFLAIYSSIKFGLMPIDVVRKKLADIKEGKSDRLHGDFPPEVVPLVNEFHDVIRQANLTEVENLAHNLKTPLSVLMNESVKGEGPLFDIVKRQSSNMNRSIEHYLQRFRRPVALENLHSMTNLSHTLSEISQNMEESAKQKNVDWVVDCDPRINVQIDHQDLLESIQEIATNAFKAAKSVVQINSSVYGSNVVINVEDDGPGIALELRSEALKRGVKLDRQTNGSGIGLSSVKNIIASWYGSIVLKSSSLGGLRVVITLPGGR